MWCHLLQMLPKLRQNPSMRNIVALKVIFFRSGSVLTGVTAYFNGTVPTSNTLTEAVSSIDFLTQGNETLIINAAAANVTGTLFVYVLFVYLFCIFYEITSFSCLFGLLIERSNNMSPTLFVSLGHLFLF